MTPKRCKKILTAAGWLQVEQRVWHRCSWWDRRWRVLGRWWCWRSKQWGRCHNVQEWIKLPQRKCVVQGFQRSDRRHPSTSFNCWNKNNVSLQRQASEKTWRDTEISVHTTMWRKYLHLMWSDKEITVHTTMQHRNVCILCDETEISVRIVTV
jgi:hypothetical protein